MNKILLILTLLLSVAGTARAQELRCSVEVNASQIEGSSKAVFMTLQEAINEYMNTTQFTDAQFSTNERIDCKLFFNITEYNDGVAAGTLQVQSTRPVYNTSYTTTLLNFQDSKIDFSYSEGEPLTFNLMNMESQLTQILNFYAYLIIALDFDSFSPRGGEAYFTRLKDIVQQAQSSGEPGWKAFEDNKNRSAVLAAYTDPSTQQLRDLTYTYHRNGLDEMALSPDKGRAKITEALPTLKRIYDVASMSVGLSMFRDAKMDELVNLYSKAPVEERKTALETLEAIYPTEQKRLKMIKDGVNK